VFERHIPKAKISKERLRQLERFAKTYCEIATEYGTFNNCMNGCESRFRCPIRKIFVDVVAADEMIVDLRRDINRLKAREKQLLERARKLRKQIEEKGDSDNEVKADIRD
jgi:hypothetical protein